MVDELGSVGCFCPTGQTTFFLEVSEKLRGTSGRSVLESFGSRGSDVGSPISTPCVVTSVIVRG